MTDNKDSERMDDIEAKALCIGLVCMALQRYSMDEICDFVNGDKDLWEIGVTGDE